MTTTQIAVRLPTELVCEVDQLVPALHASRSEVIRLAIETYLSKVAAERDAVIYDQTPLTEDELGLADDATAWDLTPKW